MNCNDSPPPAGHSLFAWFERHWVWLFSAAVGIYAAAGFFPWIVVEGDDAAVAAGALQLSVHGNLKFGLGYKYLFFPGTYTVLAALHKAFGLMPLEGLCLFTLLGFFSFVAFFSLFASKLLEKPFPLCALGLLLFQESWTAAYFGNSNMITAGILAASFWAALSSSLASCLASGILFALAAWMRLDAILVIPVFPILLVQLNRRAAMRTVAFFFTFAGLLFLFLTLSDVSIVQCFNTGSKEMERFSDMESTLRIYATLFTLVICLLYGMGIKLCLERGNLKIFFASLAGFLPLMLAYSWSVTTPKYLLYGLPFLSLPVCLALHWLFTSRTRASRALQCICICLFLLQYLYLPRIRNTVDTADGPRLRDAIGYAPILWYRMKKEFRIDQAVLRERLVDFCGQNAGQLVLAQGWRMGKFAQYELLKSGYECAGYAVEGDFFFREFRKGSRIVELLKWEGLAEVSRIRLAEKMQDRVALHPGREILFLGSLADMKEVEERERLLGRLVKVLWMYRGGEADGGCLVQIEGEGNRQR